MPLGSPSRDGDVPICKRVSVGTSGMEKWRTYKCVANGSPVTHQTLRQQGETGEDSYIHLADWTLSVATIKKKKKM